MPDDLISARENTYGIHAGELETSMMLHLQEHKCRMSRAQDFTSHIEDLDRETRHLGLGPGGKLGWKVGDLNPHGACGDATKATAETGEAAIEFVAARFVEMLGEVHAYDLSGRS